MNGNTASRLKTLHARGAAKRSGLRRSSGHCGLDPQGAIGITGDEVINRRVSIGALTVKYSLSNGSFWECSFCPKMAIMRAIQSYSAARRNVSKPPSRDLRGIHSL